MSPAARRRVRALVGVVAALVLAACAVRPNGDAPTLAQQLDASTYVYVSSQRKDGSFGKPAEIWFLHYRDAVWVGTSPASWRVKRIKAGRPAARIAVGTPDGPAFDAVGELVRDPEVLEVMFQTYARKYPDGWSKWERSFRDGMKDGSRVLVRYRPRPAP